MPRERGEDGEPQHDRSDDGERPAVLGRLGEPDEDRDGADREQDQPDAVEAERGVERHAARQGAPRDDEDGGGRDDEGREEPAPADRVDGDAAQEGAEQRPDADRAGDEAHDPAHPGGAGERRDRGQHQGLEHPAAEPLDRAGHDERRERPGERRGRRADAEERERREPRGARAEADRGPAADRDRDGHGEDVRGADPLDGAERGVEVGRDVGDRDAGDGRVEEREEAARDEEGEAWPEPGLDPCHGYIPERMLSCTHAFRLNS